MVELSSLNIHFFSYFRYKDFKNSLGRQRSWFQVWWKHLGEKREYYKQHWPWYITTIIHWVFFYNWLGPYALNRPWCRWDLRDPYCLLAVKTITLQLFRRMGGNRSKLKFQVTWWGTVWANSFPTLIWLTYKAKHWWFRWKQLSSLLNFRTDKMLATSIFGRRAFFLILRCVN